MRRLALIAAAASIGCSSVSFPFDLYVDRRFESREQCLVAEAVQRWERATSGIVDIRTYLGLRTIGYPHQVLRATEAQAQQLVTDGRFLGMTDYQANAPGGRGKMWIVPSRIYELTGEERYASVFLRVAMHEIGHHIDLDHHPDGVVGVMTASAADPCVSSADLAQFCSEWGCSLIAPPCDPPPEQCE